MQNRPEGSQVGDKGRLNVKRQSRGWLVLRAWLGLELMNLEVPHLWSRASAQPPSRCRERRTRRQGHEEPRKGVAEVRDWKVMEAGGEGGEAGETMQQLG